VAFGQLVDFIENRMHMSHVHQPLLIRSPVAAGGTATLRQLALSFLVEDESQILFYEDRIKKMPARILKKHGVIKEQGDLISLTVGPLDYGRRSRIRELCERKLQALLHQRGLDAWASRMIETDPVPPALRYQALMRSGGRCALCGATKDQATLHVDHILPRSRGGKAGPDSWSPKRRPTRAAPSAARTFARRPWPAANSASRFRTLALPWRATSWWCPFGTRPTSWLSPPTSGATARTSCVCSGTSRGLQMKTSGGSPSWRAAGRSRSWPLPTPTFTSSPTAMAGS